MTSKEIEVWDRLLVEALAHTVAANAIFTTEQAKRVAASAATLADAALEERRQRVDPEEVR